MRRHANSSTASPPLLTDSRFRQLVRHACVRVQTEFQYRAPFLAEHACAWMADLSPTAKAHDYFLQPRSFPLLQLPFWAAQNFSVEPDYEFLADIFYSTVNGYYYVRLLDNLIDGHATVELKILPATAFFHTEFQTVYQKYFDPAHEFWQLFRSSWFSANNAVTHELYLDRISRNEFEQVTVAKLAGAKIPVAAVGFRHNAGARLQCWLEFTDALAKWSQMEDDLFDWHHDLRHGKTSYFLSKASHRRHLQSVEEWVLTEGFQQGMKELKRGLSALRHLALSLHSSDVVCYLEFRQAMLECQRQEVGAAFQILRDVSKIIKPTAVSDGLVQS